MTDYAIHRLFIDELNRQLELFKKGSCAARENPGDTAATAELLRAVHSIKGSAKLVQFNEVAELFAALEGVVHSGSWKEELFSLFDQVAKIFGEMAGTAPEQLEERVTGLELKPLIEKARSLIAPKNEQSGEEVPLGNSYFDLIAPEEADRFLQNMRQTSKALGEGLQRINKNFEDKEALQRLAEVSAEVKEAGNSVHLSVIIKIGEALSACFRAAHQEQLPWTQGHADLILEAVDFLSRIGKMPRVEVGEWMEQHEKGVDSIASVLLAISHEASAVPARAVEQEEEKQTGDSEMLQIFKTELSTHLQELNDSVLKLEADPENEEPLERLMRAAHSIKGAARIVELGGVSRLAHAIEDYFISLQKGERRLEQGGVTALLNSFDLLARFLDLVPGSASRLISSLQPSIDEAVDRISGQGELNEQAPKREPLPKIYRKKSPPSESGSDRYLRVSAQNLNRLMGLAGEALVESAWLKPFCEKMMRFKREQAGVASLIDELNEFVRKESNNEELGLLVAELKKKVLNSGKNLASYLSEFELFTRRLSSLSDRLYGEVITSRMRPFADGIEHFPRMVRDLACELNKKVKINIVGEKTAVDREILGKLEAPLSHLLRNAVDHGIEPPKERSAAGKAPEGTITLEAAHKGGMLSISVSDDGSGIDLELLRQKIVEKNFVSEEMAGKLGDAELLEFIFLPGFSTSDKVTEISGRGVGLNVVQSMVQEVGGSVKLFVDGGLKVHLQLPLTLSVLRCLLAEVDNEPYAFPLARIDRVEMLEMEELQQIEHRQYLSIDGKNIGLVPAHQIFGLPPPENSPEQLPVIVINDQMTNYGIVVDRYLGEKELVLHELDPLLGKVPDISAGAFMEDGSPLLVIDVEDLVRSVDKLLSKGSVETIHPHRQESAPHHRKRVLVVDDSITVREVEARLLENCGYEVETAVNGMDGWNAVRLGNYDLVVTDVDMPRMNGIEFVRAIRGDPKLRELPVMIVSYKEREEDRVGGLEAGANYYLTKSSFHDETLIAAVEDLIGKAMEKA